MADVTPEYGWPYQEASDPPDGASLGEDLALAIEATVESIDDRVSDLEGIPIGRIVASGTVALASTSTVTIPFSGTDDIDTHGQHDPVTNNTRVTPNKAGYYRFRGTAWFAGQTTAVLSTVFFRKNGSSILAPAGRGKVENLAHSQVTEVIQAMNGTTDYIEMQVIQQSSGSINTNQSSQYSSALEWQFLRDL